jgi:membrane protein required for colicin V production
MNGLNWADWAIIGIIILSSLMSLKRGFIKEALSLATWIVAFVVARTFHPNVQTLLADAIESPLARTVAAFLILFVGTLLVGAGINFIIGMLVKLTGLTPVDRILGVVFGFARGIVLIVFMIAVLRLTPLTHTDWWAHSSMIKNMLVLEQWTRSMLENKTTG